MADAMDKTQPPTPRRRLEARQRGQVARSSDLVSAAVLLAAVLLLQATGPKVIAALRLLVQQALASPTAEFHHADAIAVGAKLAWSALPLFAGVVIIALVVNLIQVGFLIRKRNDQDAMDLAKG